MHSVIKLPDLPQRNEYSHIKGIAIGAGGHIMASSSDNWTHKFFPREGDDGGFGVVNTYLVTASAMGFSHDGQVFAAPSKCQSVIQWFPKNGVNCNEEWSPFGSETPSPPRLEICTDLPAVTAIAFSPTGNAFAYSTMPGIYHGVMLQAWDLRQNGVIQEVAGAMMGRSDVVCMAFSPDEKVVCVCNDGKVFKWGPLDANGGFEEKGCLPYREESMPLVRAAISPDARLVAVVYKDDTLEVWEISGDSPQAKLQHFRGTCVAFVDDRRFVYGGSDHHVRMCELNKVGEPEVEYNVTNMYQHTHAVQQLAVSHDGKTLVSGGGFNELLLCPLNTLSV